MHKLTEEQAKEASARVEEFKKELSSVLEKFEVSLVADAGIVDGKIMSTILIKDQKYSKKPEVKEETKSE